MRLLRKVLLFLGIILITVLAAVILFISPIAEYVIEKNSITYTGRKIEMGNLRINLITGNISISQLQIFEQNQKEIFLSIEKLSTGIRLLKAIGGKYEIKQVLINKLYVSILQDGVQFNFDDIIQKFTPSDTEQETPKAETAPGTPTQWWLRDFTVVNSTIVYNNANPANIIQLDSLQIASEGFAWDNPQYVFDIYTKLLSGGTVSSTFSIDINTLLYNTHVIISKLHTGIFLPYLTDYMYMETMNGLLSADLIVSGNGNASTQIAASGNIQVDDFILIDTSGEKLASLNSLLIGIDSLNTATGLYNFSRLICNNPFVQFAMYEDGYNFDRLTTHAVTASNASGIPSDNVDTIPVNANTVYVDEYGNVFTLLADYIKMIAEEYAVNTYSADTILIRDGNIIYTDYTLEEKFQYNMDSVRISASRLSSENEYIVFHLFSRINNSGLTEGNLSVSTADMNNMLIDYSVTGFKMSDINPYTLYYLATPFLNGNVIFQNNTSIIDNKLSSNNLLIIEDVEVGDRQVKNPRYKVPLKLALFLLTDLNNDIRIEVPVEGYLDDPDYKWGKAIWQVVENILIKAVTAPYRLLASAFGGNEEDFKELRFTYLQKDLDNQQIKVLENIAKVLEAKPGLQVELVHSINYEAEAERLAVQMVKAKYLNLSVTPGHTDIELDRISGLSSLDSMFIQFVNTHYTKDIALTSTQQKCMEIIGAENVYAALNSIISDRSTAISNYMINMENIAPEKFTVINNSDKYPATNLDVPKYIIQYSSDELGAEVMSN